MNVQRRMLGAWAMALAVLLPASAWAQSAATFSVRSMTPETAFAAARAALDHCRKQGWQVAVAVVDRSGLPQVMLRDRFAGAHTVSAATDKAWTAASFKMRTATLAVETQAGKPMSGLRGHLRVLAAGGGVPIEAAGALLGAIGVSGAPGGDADDACADAGIQAVRGELEF